MAKLTILAVDDEFGIRKGICRVLKNFTVGYPFMDEDYEFDVLDVESGEEAISVIDNQTVDIVLLDNKLPGIEGIEVLDYIKKNKPDIAVIMITSYASVDLAVDATSKGAYGFMPKPFTPQDIKAAVEGLAKHLYLKRMTSQMKQEGKEIRFKFLSVLSHELKSPINAVEGYLRIMNEKQLGENLNDYEYMITRSMERIQAMRGLIMDMLDFTKIESGKKKQNICEIDIVEIAKLSLDSIEPSRIQKNVSLKTDLPERFVTKIDVSDIEIVFNNLLSNAVKYNIDGGEIFFEIKNTSKEILISVKDTGIGISSEDEPKLFGEFIRIKNEKTKHISGSGLGLSIVKKIVESYKGEIKVDSVVGKGTVFTVLLPLND